MVQFFHFTSRDRWAEIAEAGQITPRWPREDFDPPIPKTVHLTSSSNGAGLPRGKLREVRITVDLPEDVAQPYLDWARQNLPQEVQTSLIRGPQYPIGEQQDAGTWFVVAQPIGLDWWQAVIDYESGARLGL